MQVVLIRHPPPLIEPGLCYGRLDVDCQDPCNIAEQLVQQLPANIPVISSPLRRCRRLAACLHPAPILDDRLQELDFGCWEGQPWASIPRQQLDAWAADVLHAAPHGGESVFQLQTRALALIAELHQRQFTAVTLVTHAGIMRALAGAAQALPPDIWTQLKFSHGELVVLNFIE